MMVRPREIERNRTLHRTSRAKKHSGGQARRAKRVRIEKENTTIIDGAGKKPEIQAPIGQIRPRSRRRPRATTARSSRSGAPGEARGRGRGDPRWWLDRGR